MHASGELTDESLAINSDCDNIESCDPESTVFEKDNYEITELPKGNASSIEFEDDVPRPYITLAPDSTVAALNSLGLRLEGVDHVKWRRDAAVHPRNWSTARKTFDTSLILLLDLFTTAVSTAGPSIAELGRVEYGLSRTVALVSFASMYQFGQAFGGVIFPPYSEAFGRKWVYISASLVYCLACTIAGVTPHISGVVVGRFVAGFVSAVPSIIVSGSIEDMFNMTQRVWIMYAWACATTGGLLVGPIYGSYISGSLGWRWAFYIAAMVTGVLAMLLSFIKESRVSKLLAKRLDLVRKKTGITHFRITNPDYTPDIQTFVKVALRRPVRLFFTDPIVTIVSIMSAVGWALIYLLTEALPVIYGAYGLTWSQSSLLFLVIGGGIFFGIFPRLHDHRLLQRRAKQDLPLHPEDKLLGFAVAAPSLAIGLWWLALTASPASTLPWYATLPALVPIGFATNEFACTLSGYLADTYTIYASSAFAAMSFLRAVLGGLFPLIGKPMYESLGSNWASVILAGVATIFCITPVLFRKYGMRIRKRSKFAKYSLSINRATQIHDDHME